MHTAEEILKPYVYKNIRSFGDAVTPDGAEAAMEEYSSLRNKELRERVERLEEGLREAKKCLQWTWDNMGKEHHPDHFNVPANGIEAIEQLLSTTKR